MCFVRPDLFNTNTVYTVYVIVAAELEDTGVDSEAVCIPATSFSTPCFQPHQHVFINMESLN